MSGQKVVRNLSLATAGIVLLSSFSYACSNAAQLGVAADLVPTRQLIYDVDSSALPAISKEGTEVAVVEYPGDNFTSVVVNVLSSSTSQSLKRFELLSEQEGEEATSETRREALARKMEAPNEYLASKGFIHMEPLYAVRWNQAPPDVESFLPDFANVRFDLQAGEITVVRASDGKTLFKMKRPVINRQGSDVDAPASFTQQIPVEGWVDEQRKRLVLRLQTSTRDESVYPDEWLVVSLK